MILQSKPLWQLDLDLLFLHYLHIVDIKILIFINILWHNVRIKDNKKL